MIGEIRHNLTVSKKSQLVLVLIGIVLMTAFTITYRNQLLKMGEWGYFGIFFSCLIANSTVFLPAPSSAIVFSFANVYLPFWVALVGTFGAVVGEHIGYLAGVAGRKSIEKNEQEEKIIYYVEKYGMIAVFVFAFLPLPLFDLVGIAAGAMKMSYPLFLIPCLLGKFLKMLIYAYAGASLLPLLSPLFENFLEGV